MRSKFRANFITRRSFCLIL